MIHPKHACRGIVGGGMSALVLLLWFSARLPAQVTADQAAAMVLNSARKAYNEKNYPFAAERFREFLAKYGGNKDAPSARYGLALALLASPQKNLNEVRDLLQAVAGNKNLPEHPHIVYNLGLTLRGLGIVELNIADAKPQEANQRRETARQRFEEAKQQFAQAMAAFVAKPENVPADPKKLPANLEWAARARCDQAEMHLRLQKPKEAREITTPFLKDPDLGKSQYRDLGRYYHGFASFLLKDYATAEQTLSTLAPFGDLSFGTHARYLLGRAHHLTDERAEAKLHYEGVLGDYAKNKKTAAVLLQQPAKFQNDPVEKERLEGLVKNPSPDHVVRATFYLGVLLYEGGQFGDARERFAEFPKVYPNSPLRPEAELRLGFCLVQLKDFAEAIKTLTPLVDKERRLSDQVLFWLGKAQAGAAPDAITNNAGYQKALQQAQGTFRQAADRAQQLAGMDPDARERRGEILLELADTQQLLKQSREAAGTYNQIINERNLPQREEELLQRLIAAWHLAGDYNESDKVCGQFVQKYPQSTLLPAVLFRHAENNYFRVLAVEKNTNAKDLAKLHDETIKRYQVIVEKYPEAPQINPARYSLGLTYYRKGELDKAQQALTAIPLADRNGDLAIVPYVMADCLMRLAPKGVPEDALEAGKLEEQLKKAADLLENFIDSQPKSPQTADALLKLGLCKQRLATVLGQPPERAQALAAARTAYEKILAQFGNDPVLPQAVLERAKCMAQMNDVNGAINELRRFIEPLKNAAVAPMGLIELATLLRGQNKALEAAAILAKGREQHEGNLTKDPQRAGWVALLRYHHGVALREGGKLVEARTAFELVFKQAANQPEAAEAALRFGQCLKEEGQGKIEAANKARTTAKKPEEINAANKVQSDGYKMIGDALQFLESQAEQLKQKQPAQETRARMYYETAWGYRLLADRDIEATRAGKIQELLKKRGPDAATLPPPDVPLSAIPVQASEKKAWGQYQALIAGFPDLPLASEARFELAELYAQRHDYDQAVKLLGDGLDKEPPPELTDKIRIRLGTVHAAKGDKKAALAQFKAVALNPKSPLLGQAIYRAGECLMQDKQWAEAIKQFVNFRDQQPLQNVPGLSDRALLRLGQAYAQMQNWDQSRQAHERLVGAFPNSPWLDDARYGIGWAWQQQKQYDQAVNTYSQVVARTATATAAKAQLQIGLCRFEQKRYPEAANALLVVPFTYDYPELSAAALLEAARAFTAMKENSQAIRLLERLLRDHPTGPWAEAARERLQELRGTKNEK